MIVTTYTCDKCGHQQTEKTQMWNIGVRIDHHGDGRAYNKWDEPQTKQLWCRKCIESIGLLVPTPKPDEEAPAPPTLEDMIREIVDNEVHNAIQNAGD